MKQQMPFLQSLVTRIILVFLAGLLLVTVPPLWILYNKVRENVGESAREEAILLCKCCVTQFEQDFMRWETAGDTLVSRLSNDDADLSNAALRDALEDAMDSTDSVYAVAVAFEPGVLPEGNGEPLMLLRRRGTDKPRWEERRDFLEEEWYHTIKNTGKAQWLEPFVGKVVGELIAVYAVPLYRKSADGRLQFIGVACIDILCSQLQKDIAQLRPDGDDYALLLSQKQTVLACRNPKNLGKKLVKMIDYQTEMDFEAFSRKLDSGQPVDTVVDRLRDGEKYHIFCQSMDCTDWTFVLIFPETRITMVMDAFHRSFAIMIATGIVKVALLALLVYFCMGVPLRKVKRFALEIGRGRLDEPAPKAPGNGEVAALVHTIDNMRNSLKEHIANVQEMTKQQERAANELVVAKNIQLGILPDRGSSAFSHKAFSVAADMTPAREVGGDMYDVVLLSPTKLFIAIGDVSGKGIPAAMVMVVTQTLMRGLLQSDEVSPAKLVTALNDKLCVYKNLKSFITYFLGILDLESGELTYCNAGHNPFLVLKASGGIETPCRRNGIPVGVKPGCIYTESQCNLGKGDAILLYTDGVVDAENTQHQFFGMDRLREVAEECAARHAAPEEVGKILAQTVADFSAQADQHDDMTYLCVRRNGKI